MLNFIKENKTKIILGLISILIVSLSFGLGFLIAEQYYQAPIIIEKHSK